MSSDGYYCRKEKVSFKTEEGVKLAAGKSYYERMTYCYTRSLVDGKELSFEYISRAYRSNEVFVYRRDTSNQKIYLENLSTNVSIADELNSFDFVEY